ncbi:MAG: hypothetical protein KDD35_08515 [Bdellovibrionales bacterium]|nr:hypothetical protein [Bdellovibrionales bacterium]
MKRRVNSGTNVRSFLTRIAVIFCITTPGGAFATVLMPFAAQAMLSLFGIAAFSTHGFQDQTGYEIMGKNRFDTEALYHVALWPRSLDNPHWNDLALLLEDYRNKILSKSEDMTLSEMFGPILESELNTPQGKWFNPKYHSQRGIDLSLKVRDFLQTQLAHSALLMARTIEYCNHKPESCFPEN